MTDKKYDITNIEEIEGNFIVSITLYSKEHFESNAEEQERLREHRIAHANYKTKTSTIMEFDHSPSDEDIIAKAEEYGHSFTTNKHQLGQNIACESVYEEGPIVAVTAGEDDAVHWSSQLHPEKHLEMLDLVDINLEVEPSSVCRKGDWLHIYWTNLTKPVQFFEDDFFAYSIRVHIDTGEIKRKGYHKGNPLGLPEFDEYIGNLPTVATGIYLDEDRVTIYYPKTNNKEDQVLNVAMVDRPYLGTTFEDGVAIRTREYLHKNV